MPCIQCALKTITNSTRFTYKNVFIGMNYRVNIGCRESGTKEGCFRRWTCGPMIENRDSDLSMSDRLAHFTGCLGSILVHKAVPIK